MERHANESSLDEIGRYEAVSLNYQTQQTYCAHDGELGISQSTNKAKDFMAFYDELQERMQKIVCERTAISAEELEKNSRKEWYMFSEEARDRGVIDGIIGDDIDIAEVL